MSRYSDSMRIEELRKEIEKLCGNCDRPDKEELGKIILSSMTLGFNEGLKASSANRPQGEWIEIAKFPLTHTFMCSQCGRTVEDAESGALVLVRYPFCHCGADMRGKGDE